MITGKINAKPYEFRVDTMKVGDTGYVNANQFIITKSAIFLDLFSPVLFFEDIGEISGDFIAIERLGPGYTEKDYELDFSESDDYNFPLDSNAIYNNLMREKDLYVVFRKFEIGMNYEFKEVEDYETIEELEIQLNNALGVEDYCLAAKLRNRITEKKKTGKEK